MATTKSQGQFSQSSMRLLDIIECLAEATGAMRLQEIARKTGISQPTVLRYLSSLEAANYVYKDDDTHRYALTWRIRSLSRNLGSQLSLRNITTPFTNRLANELKRGVCLVIEHDDQCLYLDCIESPLSRTLQRIGKKAPLHSTGSGKILLSTKSEADLSRYINEIGLMQYTKYTITDPEMLRAELNKIRKNDFAMDEEECEIGLRCISCPLRDYTGQIVAAVSIFGSKDTMSDSQVFDMILPRLREATNEISSRLGYIFPDEP